MNELLEKLYAVKNYLLSYITTAENVENREEVDEDKLESVKDAYDKVLKELEGVTKKISSVPDIELEEKEPEEEKKPTPEELLETATSERERLDGLIRNTLKNNFDKNQRKIITTRIKTKLDAIKEEDKLKKRLAQQAILEKIFDDMSDWNHQQDTMLRLLGVYWNMITKIKKESKRKSEDLNSILRPWEDKYTLVENAFNKIVAKVDEEKLVNLLAEMDKGIKKFKKEYIYKELFASKEEQEAEEATIVITGRLQYDIANLTNNTERLSDGQRTRVEASIDMYNTRGRGAHMHRGVGGVTTMDLTNFDGTGGGRGNWRLQFHPNGDLTIVDHNERAW